MGDAYSHVRSAHRLSAGPRRSRGGCSGVAVAPTEGGGALVFAVAAVFPCALASGRRGDLSHRHVDLGI